MLLPTTSVGSFPKPDYLKKARSQFARKQISREELYALERKATQECIAHQEEAGIDIIVDGEMYRGDMCAYFAENLIGTKISGLVRSYGNRYYKKPIVTGKIKRKKPITVDWWKYSQSLTPKPVKGMLTGPYTMMDWTFNEYYPNRRAVALAFADVINQEARDLMKAGATFIQIDEPAVSVRVDELELAIEAMKRATKGLGSVKTATHICYGDFAKIYPKMLELPVDQIDLEMTNSDFELLNLFKKKKFTKEIGLGVVDVHSHVIEKKKEIEKNILRAMEVIPAKQIYVDPDCGLKTRSENEAYAKLSVMCEAVDELRRKRLS